MAKASYEYCVVEEVRCDVEARLDLPAGPAGRESAEAFWVRVDRAGRLVEAISLYDELAAERAAWARVPRETKAAFLERVGREGLQAEVERVRAELVASGLTQREAQVDLVERFQPLDGTETRAWETPDPWEAGRLFRRKADQDRLLARVEYDDDADYHEAENRVAWARLRREEGDALAVARRRARALKASAPTAEATAPIT